MRVPVQVPKKRSAVANTALAAVRATSFICDRTPEDARPRRSRVPTVVVSVVITRIALVEGAMPPISESVEGAPQQVPRAPPEPAGDLVATTTEHDHAEQGGSPDRDLAIGGLAGPGDGVPGA